MSELRRAGRRKAPLVVLAAAVLFAGVGLYLVGFHVGYPIYSEDKGPTKAGYSQWLALYRRMVFAKIDTEVPYAATKRPQWMRATVSKVYHGYGKQSARGPKAVSYVFIDVRGAQLGEGPFPFKSNSHRAREGDKFQVKVKATMVRSSSLFSPWSILPSGALTAPPWSVQTEVVEARPLPEEDP